MKYRSNIKRLKSFLIPMMVACAAMVLGTSDAVAAKTNWKMHIVWVKSRPEARAYQEWVDIVNRKTGDDFNITLYTGGSLGVSDADMLRILPKGNVIQAAGLYPGYLSRDRPQYAYTLPPGVVSQPETLEDLLPQLRNIYENTYDDVSIKLLGFVGHAVRNTHIMCKEPVNSLEELKNRKLRVWGQFQVDVFKKLDISAQIIGQNELYVAMQRGVVDCAVYPIGLATTVSLQEVAPYASYLFPYVLHPLNLIVSQEAYGKLPPETQTIMQEAARTVQKQSFQSYLSGVNDKKALETFREDGGTLLDPFPKEDLQKFREVSRETWKEKSYESGEKARKNYEILSDAIE